MATFHGLDLRDHGKALNSVGWFIPPYLSLGFLGKLKDAIQSGRLSDQVQLETALAFAYSPNHLAAMVCERYPVTPYIQEYKDIIAEAVQAHFLGLGHVAVSGLLPVVEGVGRKLAQSRSLTADGSIKAVFTELAKYCKIEAAKNDMAVNELECMLDSFVEFARSYLYVQSDAYALDDKTNRHGALHGAYADGDYGRPISFYKIIGSVDFLCMVSAFRANVSWLAPDPTESSVKLAASYTVCMALSGVRTLALP